MAGPADWGAQPVESGPASWGALPVETTPKAEGSFPLSAAERVSQIPATVTDVPHEIYEAGKSALSSIGENLNPFSASKQAAYEEAGRQPSFMGSVAGTAGRVGDVGKGLLAVPELAASPITGAARSAIGHPYSALTGIPYDQSKEAVDTAMMGLGPGRGGLSTLRGPAPVPPRPPTGPLGVTLSEGQATGELPAIRSEQAALRGQSGSQAEGIAKDFADQQAREVAAAKEGVAQGLDPFGQQVAETPQEAGALVSDAMQQAAAKRKSGVTQAYDTAKSYPGEIHASAFDGIGQKIKGELSLRDDPVIIDDKLTPYASHAIQDIENRVSKLTIQNRADPFGQPNPENITGVNLKGVDQMRKRLSAFRKDAFASGNSADGRAAQAVLDSFDNQIDSAVNGGLFNGDHRAIEAWNDARAAHADYRNTFTAGKGDPIGRVVERILGKGKNPAAIPNDVADFIYGSSGVNPNSLNVAVANRVKGVLGDRSPEWSGVKQGLFSRLVEPAPGVTDWGPQKIAQRLNRFLNGDGRELANAVLTPSDRSLVQSYADLQRSLEVPPTGVNRSETSSFVIPHLKKISGGIAALVGAAVGHALAPGLGGAGELIGAGIIGKGSMMVRDAANARKIAAQMKTTQRAIADWQKAVAAVNRTNSPPSQAALSLAATNLARSLGPLGIKLDPIGQLQGTVPGRADQNQQQ